MSGRSVTLPHCSWPRASLLEAVNQYLVPILSPVTDNMLFLNQQKGELFYPPDAMDDLGTAAYKADTLLTELPCLVVLKKR